MIIHECEQGSKEWYQLRHAKVTGTTFGKIFGADDLKVVDRLIAETVSDEIEETGYKSEEMQRGDEYEPLVRKEYEKQRAHKVDVFGFISSERFPWMGYSPDGIIKVGEVYRKAIEIKCPDTKTHVRYIRMDKVPNEYKHQVLLIFLVCPTIEEVTFISYDPRFYKRPYWSISVARCEMIDEIKAAESKATSFREKFEKYYEQVTF